MNITAQGSRLRNDLYCVEWDIKLYYTIPYMHCTAFIANPSVCRWELHADGNVGIPQILWESQLLGLNNMTGIPQETDFVEPSHG